MTRRLTKVLSVFLSLSLVFSAVSAPALAEMGEEDVGGTQSTTTTRESGSTTGSVSANEGSSIQAELGTELAEEGLKPQSHDDLALTPADGQADSQAVPLNAQTVTALCEEPVEALETQTDAVILPAATANDWQSDYSAFGVCRVSYLHLVDGRPERVEYQKTLDGSGVGELIVERIDGSLRYATSHGVVSQSTYVPSDLASQDGFVWGGFYSGASHNYVLTGQTNYDQDDNLTVFRLSKYTKTWQYAGCIEIKGANTVHPFYLGSCSMVELNGDLHIRTCHRMYDEGHQANASFVIDESQMSVKNQMTHISYWPVGYVSHSFTQLLAQSGDAVFGLDHGDAYPRSFFIMNLTSPELDNVQLIEFKGRIGANTTGGSVGGMEHSSSTSRLLVAGNLADQTVLFETDGQSDYSVARNVFVATSSTPKLDSSSVRYLTSNAPNGGLTTTTPHLVKINDNRFLVLWGERNLAKYYGYGNKVYYQFVDGQGNALSTTQQVQGMLSDCAPVLWGNRVVWYTGGSRHGATGFTDVPTFYAIGAYDGSFARYAPFPDVPTNAWYADVMVRATGLGLLGGYDDGRFGPDDNITRGQVAVVLWKMARQPAGARDFPDVHSDDYFYQAVRWAGSVGVVNGYANGNFGPDDKVTREQLATMLANYAQNVAHRQVTGSEADYDSMTDKGNVSGWAAPSVGWCFQNGILNGSNGQLRPQGNASRAEACKMVVYLYDMLG